MKKGKECLVSVMLSSWLCETQAARVSRLYPSRVPDAGSLCVLQIQLCAEQLLPEA